MKQHSEEHYRKYFGPQADYHLGVLNQMEEGKKNVFNFYAFLFGIFWLLYRRMYWVALAFLAIAMLWGLIESGLIELFKLHQYSEIIGRGSMFLLGGILGAFINRIYLKRSNTKISKIIDTSNSEEEIDSRLKEAGGITFIPHLFMVFIVLLVIYLGKQGHLDFLNEIDSY